MSKKVGKDAKVTVGVAGTAVVVGMGTWSMPGVTTESFDVSSFQDDWKTFLYGMKDGGTITFNGWFDPDDVTGQMAMAAANAQNLAVTDLCFFVDNTSYFVPNQTTGYFSPGANSTGMGTPGLCSINITDYGVTQDKSGVGTVTFAAKINGCMAFV